MTRRTIYVSPARAGLYDQAALLAGSLSSAIEEGLRLYVARRREATAPFAEIEVPVGRGAARTRKRFVGRELDEFLLDDGPPGRLHGATVYLTRRGRLAAWCWSEPDWAARATVPLGALLGQDDPRGALLGQEEDDGWGSWGERRGEELVVAEDLDELGLHLPVPLEVAQRLTVLIRTSPVEVLDI